MFRLDGASESEQKSRHLTAVFSFSRVEKRPLRIRELERQAVSERREGGKELLSRRNHNHNDDDAAATDCVKLSKWGAGFGLD